MRPFGQAQLVKNMEPENNLIRLTDESTRSLRRSYAKPKMKTKLEPYIETHSGVRRGAPVIAGTSIKVLDVAVRYEVMGTPEEIIIALPHLTLPQIHAALSYYYAHKRELDKQWKASVKKVARLRLKTSSVLEEKLGPIKNLHG